MAETSKAVFFSVILPTRNRPELFKVALDSILRQTFSNLEVIVVNDGSEDSSLEAYKSLEAEYGDCVRWFYQPRRPNGHGQSYSMNSGAYLARGEYLAFLDDDDEWTDPEHLSRMHAALQASNGFADLAFSDQTAFRSDGSEIVEPLWLASLSERVGELSSVHPEVYAADVDFLLSARGFAHLNCTIAKRSLYLDIGGMDENVRYECDRDVYLRLIDAAASILYSPRRVSRHNVPDPRRKDNMSTLVSDLEKRLYQVVVLEKNLLFARHPRVRTYARGSLVNTYKHMSSVMKHQGRFALAAQHARMALGLRYSLKWHCYSSYLTLRSWVSSAQ